MTCHHHPLQCYHLPWCYHFLISYNTSTYNGIPGVSTRIYHWPTFSLVYLYFPVPQNQPDKLLVLESPYICSWMFDLGSYCSITSTLPWGPSYQIIHQSKKACKLPFTFLFFLFSLSFPFYLLPPFFPFPFPPHSLSSLSLNSNSPWTKSDNTRQLRSTGKY